KIIPPRFAFAGDSLTANGRWGWILTRTPLSVANLAQPGATVSEVAVQVRRAYAYRAEFLLVMAGTNEINRHPVEQIICNYRYLIDEVPSGQKVIVTLIPYTAFGEDADKIRSINEKLRSMLEHRGVAILDINPSISKEGILLNDMTVDGVHFSERAYRIW